MGLDVVLQETSERESSQEDPLCPTYRQDAVRVHFLHEDANLTGCRSDHTWQEESREIIGDNHAGPLPQFSQKAFAWLLGRFQIGIVEHPVS